MVLAKKSCKCSESTTRKNDTRFRSFLDLGGDLGILHFRLLTATTCNTRKLCHLERLSNVPSAIKRPFHTPHAWASCPSHCQARSETDCHGRLGRRSIFRTLCLSQPPRQFHASIGKGSACLPVPAQCRLPVAKPTKSLTEKTVCLVTYWQERSLICLSLSLYIYMCVCVRA